MAFSNRTIIQKINERANETVPSVAIVAQADCGHADFETASYAEPAEVRNMLLACERAAAYRRTLSRGRCSPPKRAAERHRCCLLCEHHVRIAREAAEVVDGNPKYEEAVFPGSRMGAGCKWRQ